MKAEEDMIVQFGNPAGKSLAIQQSDEDMSVQFGNPAGTPYAIQQVNIWQSAGKSLAIRRRYECAVWQSSRNTLCNLAGKSLAIQQSEEDMIVQFGNPAGTHYAIQQVKVWQSSNQKKT